LIKGDEDVIAKMIDSDRVFNNVMNCTERILEISPYFLFSLLLRRAFKEKRKDTKFIERTIEALNKTEPVIPWDKTGLWACLKTRKFRTTLQTCLHNLQRVQDCITKKGMKKITSIYSRYDYRFPAFR
jgi:hypothetical protein